MIRAVLLLTLLLPPLTAQTQPTDPPEGATISTAQVSGFDLGRLSPGLQEEIARLAGMELNRVRLNELAARIEEEHPRYVAAVRVVRTPDDEVRVVFVVANMRDQDRRANVNARYLIDHIEIVGIRETELSAEIRAELRTLVGLPLGADAVTEMENKLRDAMSDYELERKVGRGGRSGEVTLVFQFRKMESARWLRFQPLAGNVVYHSDQGWGALLDLPIGGQDFRVTPIIAIDSGDDLIEEYSGFGLRFESRKLGTERLGASFEWTAFDQDDWRAATLAAIAQNPAIPGAYDDRTTITPMIRFAVTPQLTIGGGVSITELEPLSGIPESQTANAAVVSATYEDSWRRGSDEHHLSAGLLVRSASDNLESDFRYTRYFGRGSYQYQLGKHTVFATTLFGGISGSAPLFERFSLGDSQTLRGWDKYDIAPAGGDRMFYASGEYQWQGLAAFLDVGSVWDDGAEAQVRVSSGLGIHAGPFFMLVGFPLNTDDVRAVFMTGLRFGGIGYRKD